MRRDCIGRCRVTSRTPRWRTSFCNGAPAVKPERAAKNNAGHRISRGKCWGTWPDFISSGQARCLLCFGSRGSGRFRSVIPGRDDASVRGRRKGRHLMPCPNAVPACLSVLRARTAGVRHWLVPGIIGDHVPVGTLETVASVNPPVVETPSSTPMRRLACLW